MSSKIYLLPESLINKISAGEVVERPASVVKELVENSLDAGASHILIELEAGGKKLIRVKDNGEGMNQDDALLALERHATSKIRKEADLFAINSLGFRGEALPSISAVSRLTLKTRDEESELGSRIRVEGGVIKKVKKEAMPRGTMVEIENLFFNVPARRKFLKSIETELGHITELVSKIALAYPEIGFELYHSKQTLFLAPPSARLLDRAYQILGNRLSPLLIQLEREFNNFLEKGSLKVSGLISPPELTFSTTRHLYLYINRRYVKDKLLTHSLLEAYRTLIPKARYPAVILFLEMPKEGVDVNVHPTKLEVRFSEAGKIYQAVLGMIQDALRAQPQQLLVQENLTQEHKARVEQSVENFFSQRQLSTKSQSKFGFPTSYKPAKQALEQMEKKFPPEFQKTSAPIIMEPAQVPLGAGFSQLRIIGQFHSNYLILEALDGLIIIDQHALHERINFEKLKTQIQSQQVQAQNLLFPEVIEMSFQSAQVIKDHLEIIKNLGFEIEQFGGNSFLVKTTPSLLGALELQTLFQDLADELSELARSKSLPDKIDHLLSVIACHSSVRAGKTLSEPEIRALLEEMDTLSIPGQCPHGRPALWKIPLKEIEKKFSR